MNGHVLSARHARVIRIPGPARGRSRDRSDGRDALMRGRHRLKPAWHVLYVVVAVTMLLFVLADVESPTGGWRMLTECLGTVLIIGVMALWVRANRAALAASDDAPYGEGHLRSSEAWAPRPSSLRRLDSSGIERSDSSLAHTRPAEKEDPKCFTK